MKDDTQLAQWLADYCNGVISAEDFTALEQHLRSSAEARAYFRSFLHLDAELRQRAERDPALEQAWAPASVVPSAAPQIVRPLWSRATPWLALAATVVLLAVLAWVFLPRTIPMGEVVATVSESSGAELMAGGRKMTVQAGATLRAGGYELRAGLVEFSYASGAVVIIESPAQFELRGTSAVGLRAGKLSARVPEPAVGFTVETPAASVVDLGTEFGVHVGARSSEVHVFKGEVLVKTGSAAEPQRLMEHQASRIDDATRTPAGIDVAPENFVRTLQETPNRYAREIRDLQPVAYYRMRMMPDGTTLKDVASGHHDGQVRRGRVGNPWASGKIGSALRLHGVEAGTYALAGYSKATDASLSVCAWVLAESRPRWASIAKNWAKSAGNNHGGQFHFGLWDDEGSLEVHIHDRSGNEVGVRENQPLPLGEWQLVAFTLDGTTLRLYRNGSEVAATPCAGLSTVAPSALGIGVKLNASGREPERATPGFWSGRIDELAIFHRALTAEEIATLHQISLR